MDIRYQVGSMQAGPLARQEVCCYELLRIDMLKARAYRLLNRIFQVSVLAVCILHIDVV
jgi:hypothetical protein